MNNDLTRLEKIKSERKELLNKIKESLNNNKCEYCDSLTEITSLIDYDDKSIKKYEAVVKSQELISKLIMEVLNSKNPEDIIKLRNKINYLINKVKKELKSRNVNNEELALYEEKTNYMRKSISTYVRCLKRDNNLNEIHNLMANYDSLSLDDMRRLKKLLKNEKRYNTRHKQDNLEKNNIKTKEINKEPFSELDTLFDGKPREIEKEPFSELNTLFDGKPRDTEEKEEFSELRTLFDGKPRDIEKEEFSELSTLLRSQLIKKDDSKKEGKDALLSRVNSYNIQYGIKDLYEYSPSFAKNLLVLLKNIPLYIANNSKVKYMTYDVKNFYSGSDLISYIAYTKKRNSIINGLKNLFSKSYLYNGEGYYLNIHDDCTYWLYNYCESRNMPVKSLLLR